MITEAAIADPNFSHMHLILSVNPALENVVKQLLNKRQHRQGCNKIKQILSNLVA